MKTDCHIISTHDDVLCKMPQDVTRFAPCICDEVKTGNLLHVSDAVKEGHTKVQIRTVNTNILVLTIAAAQRLKVHTL